MEALHQCAKIGLFLQRKIRQLFALGLLCFYSSLNVFNLRNLKNLRTNYTFLIKPKCVLLIWVPKRNDKFLKSTLIISDK